MKTSTDYKLRPFPEIRRFMSDTFAVAKNTPLIHTLFEVDVTDVKASLKSSLRDRGKPISMTAFILHAYAHTLSEFESVRGLRKGRKKMVVFEDVDIFITVERRDIGSIFPIAVIIRKAHQKGLEEINRELREAQKKDPASYQEVQDRRKLFRLPGFLRRMVLRRIFKNPFLLKKYYGTALLTSLTSHSGDRSWWGMTFSGTPVTLIPAGVHRKIIERNGKFETRLYMNLTMSFNHDIIDGAEVKRFVTAFIKKLETNYGISKA